MYASETIQNCKNPTGHIDTLNKIRVNARVIEGWQTQNFSFPLPNKMRLKSHQFKSLCEGASEYRSIIAQVMTMRESRKKENWR